MTNRKYTPIGIDLGTTYSVVAFIDSDGRPTTIRNDAGDFLTPSAVSFEESTVVIGKEAIKSSVFAPSSFADCFKRDIGRPYFRRPIDAHQVPPEVLSAFILERLKLDAEKIVGPVRNAVVTVPAFFDETRRKATQDAAKLAGLDLLDIINEPTAAAIAFGYYQSLQRERPAGTAAKPHTILVYDLGGGTFDVSILKLTGTLFQTLATDGDVQLGGRDFDERLVNYAAEQFVAAHGVNPLSDQHDAMQLWLDVADAKHALSERSKVTLLCSHASIRMRFEITRAKFEELTHDLLERTEITTQFVLKQAQLDWNDIDRVLLVGGASRMPMVAEMLTRVTGKEPDRSVSPDEVVAHGAAIYANLLQKAADTTDRPDFKIINVNSLSLGIVGIDPQTGFKRNVIIIPKNSPLPCKAVRRFSTARPNQRSVRVAVVEGESERPEHCISLGECVIRDLPPGLPQKTEVEVEYEYAPNGRIAVRARVPVTRQSAAVDIKRDLATHLGDLASWRKRLCGDVKRHDPAEGAAELNDTSSLVERLDQLLIALGRAAAKMQVPAALQSSQQAVRQADLEHGKAIEEAQGCERQRQSAVGQTEVLHATSELARAKTALQRAATRCRFTLLVLGRESYAANVCPPGQERTFAAIRELMSQQA